MDTGGIQQTITLAFVYTRKLKPSISMKKTSIKSFNVVSYNFFHNLLTVLAKDTGGSS